MRGDGLVLPVEDVHHQGREVGGVKGVLERRHLVQDTPERPTSSRVIDRGGRGRKKREVRGRGGERRGGGGGGGGGGATQ